MAGGVPPQTLGGIFGMDLAGNYFDAAALLFWLPKSQDACAVHVDTRVCVCVCMPALLTASLPCVQLCIPGIAGVVDETVACNINAAFHCGWCKSLGQAALVFQREPRTNSQPDTHRLGINRAGVRVQDGQRSGEAVEVKGGGGDK